MTEASNTTFVCCIEPGLLEPMAVRLLESLRKHGGRFANSRFVACQPRFGAPLSRTTLDQIQKLGGEHRWLWSPRKLDWYHYLNKAVALVDLDPSIDTEWVTFLDSDMLIASEPSLLVAADADFIACAPDNGIVGSTGPGHRMDPAWRSIIESLGLPLDDVPMLREHDTGREIRFYFNSGLFSYRKSTGFAAEYKKTVEQALEANLGFPEFYEHFTDQVVLGLCALRMGLRWRELPIQYNLAVDRSADELPDESLAAAVVLHYHKGLTGDASRLLSRLQATHPQLASWLAPQGALKDPRSAVTVGPSELLRIGRGLPRALYRRRLQERLAKLPAQ